jgi:hypothetical protein
VTRVRADGIGQGSLGRVPRVRVISDTTLRADEPRILTDGQGREWMCRERPRTQPSAMTRVRCSWDAHAVELVLEPDGRRMQGADLAGVIESAMRLGGSL